MAASTNGVPGPRQPIGQLLVKLLHQFRLELLAAKERSDLFPGVGFAHLAVFGSIGVRGIRLTELAERASLSLAACSELLNELQELGYVERRPDPSDGRAKLIFPTELGRESLRAASQEVQALEHRWAAMLPEGDFERACRALDELVRNFAAEEDRVRLS